VKHLLFIIATMIFSAHAYSVTIEFPQEELAKESVLPVFEGGTTAVKSRRVVTSEHVEVGIMGGMVFKEPFFDPYTYGAHIAYHFNEFSSVALNANMRQDKVSDDANQVDKDLGQQNAEIINFAAVPVPKYFATVDYQLTPYYGKISLSKDSVMNIALYVYGGIGMIDLGGESTWIADLGLGQTLYFTRNLGLRFDMKFLMYNGPNVVSRPDLTNPNHAANPTQQYDSPTVSPSAFDKQFNVSPSVMLGLVYLL